jgi:peptidoglycan/xylan/chitin deacetylase (PgdA/CDA1 family)
MRTAAFTGQRRFPPGRIFFYGLWTFGLASLGGMALSVVPAPAWAAASIVLGLCVSIAVGSLWQRSGIFADPVNHRIGVRGMLSLTFDDGPDPRTTPPLLDLLARRGHQATFFAIANQVAAHPELARRILAQGHELANHTTAHAWHMALWPRGAVARDLLQASAQIQAHTGAHSRYFRPPAAVLSPRIAGGAREAGLVLVGHTVRSGDGSPLVSSTCILRRLRRGLHGGAILLLHDRAVRGHAPASHAILPALLGEMEGKGLRSVTLSELLST